MGCIPFFHSLIWPHTVILDPQRKDLRSKKEAEIRALKVWVSFWEEMKWYTPTGPQRLHGLETGSGGGWQVSFCPLSWPQTLVCLAHLFYWFVLWALSSEAPGLGSALPSPPLDTLHGILSKTEQQEASLMPGSLFRKARFGTALILWSPQPTRYQLQVWKSWQSRLFCALKA